MEARTEALAADIGHGKIAAMSYYILNGHTPVSTDPVTWRRWYASADRVVARTAIDQDVPISTVFVSLDMGCDADAPLLFESMVMEGGIPSGDARRLRYATWAEAERGHADMVRDYRNTRLED